MNLCSCDELEITNEKPWKKRAAGARAKRTKCVPVSLSLIGTGGAGVNFFQPIITVVSKEVI